ncbi:MAG TPA: DNA polymerase III subunit alpha [Gammaproteobacteria bacterium]|nr:DNA polymerase III subunit alpha [Gammaproteobacteria bacterium]
MSQPFVHLRLHSEFSINDGIVRIKPVTAAVAGMQMPALAITDNNNLFGLIKFYSAASAAGVKPIVACDVWVASGNENEDPTPLVLLARNEKGYLNLSELLSKAYLEGQHLGKANLKKSWIADQADGLIALSAGHTGDVGRALLNGKPDEARQLAQQWMDIFPAAYYLELHRTGKVGEEEYISAAVDLAFDLDCPVVATNDVRFLQQEEFEAHEVRVCIHDSRTLDDPRRERKYTNQQYLKSAEEMCKLFSDIPEAIENTVEIAMRCSVNIDLGNYYLPEYPVPEGYSTESYFCEVSEAGLEQRLKHILDPTAQDYADQLKAYQDRLSFELGVINKMGFPGYFLIVMEFIQWAQDNDIPVGPGRGSGAGSLVAYALMITDVDPLEYDLLFERFLNPERVSLPDFDIDFCMDGRDRVIQHVMDRYGRNAVSMIITFGTMAAKAVVRDVARVQGKPYGLADKLSKLIPFDPGMTLAKALEEEPLLREFIAQNDDADEIMDMAFKLEGITRNVGKHAAGVVIAPTKISDFSPIYCDEAGGGLITQFDKDDVEKAGLVKFDFLGLRTLTIIHNAVKSVNKRKLSLGAELVDIDKIPLEDPAIYENLRAAKTTAVFQLESRGMKDLMKQVKPGRFGDIVALVALFRPGPMQLAPDFIKRKSGVDKVDYLHPSLQPVLEGTYGVMLYQEQVMQIAQVLAGYTLADADLLRRAMGKKKPEEMAKQRDGFLKGAIANGVDEKQADHIFNLMEKFAGYGFNKPHSVAYALIAYHTAWLKHYYPADFMAAVLSADMQTTDKVVINVEECREIGVKLSPPDVNRGDYKFVADTDESIIYGLGAIKGLGEGPIETIVDSRRTYGGFEDLYKLCERVDARKMNKRAIEALIGCGALDELVQFEGQDESQKTIDFRRALLFANTEDAVKVAEQKAHNLDGGLMDLFGEDMMSNPDRDTPYNHFDGLRCLTFKDRLNKEKDALGLYLTGHPIDLYKGELKHLAKTRIVDLRASKDEQIVAGLIVGMRTMKSRKGETIAFVTLDDRSGRLEVGVFSELYEMHHGILQKDLVVFFKGSTSIDDFTGGIRMRASEVYDLVQARERSVKRLRLSLNGMKLKDNFTSELAEILEPFKGQAGRGCPVSIAYTRANAQAEVTLGDAWRVSPDDDLIQNLRDRYGADQVILDY